MKHFQSLIMILLLQTILVKGQTAGTLDITFGNNGFITTPLAIKYDEGISAEKILRQTDGKYLVKFSGYNYYNGSYIQGYHIYRFGINGQVDSSFGTNGSITFDFELRQFFLLPDGKLLTCGHKDDEIILARFLSNGQPDLNFGFQGISYTGLYFEANATLLLRNGKFLIAGSHQTENGSTFIRLEANGSRDLTYGPDGIRYYPYDQTKYTRYLSIMKETDDGKILIGGTLYGNNQVYATMVRLNNRYNYDSTFSNDGEQQLAYQGFNIQDFQHTGDGKIIVSGQYYYNNYQGSNLVISRLKVNGTPDSTFGSKSIRTSNFGGVRDFSYNLLVQPDGKPLIAGSSDSRFGLLRLNTAGVNDVTFNNTGKSTSTIANANDAGIRHLEMEADGKLLVAGYAYNKDSTASFILSRYYSGYNTGLTETRTDNNLKVYPNPAGSSCILEFTLQDRENVCISLYDATGKLISSKSAGIVAAGQYAEKLDLDQLQQGIYILVLEHGTDKKTLKITKE